MKKSPHSEEELLDIIVRELPSPSGDVITGIGDDCAVIRPSPKRGLLELLKTDALVEGIHYVPGTPLHHVGWKALCRPISDIASMGGTPLHAVVTVAAPSSWGSAEWRSLYRGLGKAAREFGVSIIGGETVRSPGPTFLSVALTGQVPRTHLRLRSGAKQGDLICVTGKLGGSLRSGRHLRFQPRVAEGKWLAGERGVTSMMDLSDGLGSDLPKLARASNCSFRVALNSLPLHQSCSVKEGISDGEDYELLVTITPTLWPALQGRWGKASHRLKLTPIGVMTSPKEFSTLLPHGFDHMAPLASSGKKR
jgi:thiamine-monophosphate kinase